MASALLIAIPRLGKWSEPWGEPRRDKPRRPVRFAQRGSRYAVYPEKSTSPIRKVLDRERNRLHRCDRLRRADSRKVERKRRGEQTSILSLLAYFGFLGLQ